MQAAAGAPDDSALFANLPPRLQASLMTFQREGVAFALRHGGRALIADEMGLVRQTASNISHADHNCFSLLTVIYSGHAHIAQMSWAWTVDAAMSRTRQRQLSAA